MKMKKFGLNETKLFHCHGIFKNWGWGGGSSKPPEPPLDPPLVYHQKTVFDEPTCIHMWYYQVGAQSFQPQTFRPGTFIFYCNTCLFVLIDALHPSQHFSVMLGNFPGLS